jgi:hypothetical protein
MCVCWGVEGGVGAEHRNHRGHIYLGSGVLSNGVTLYEKKPTSAIVLLLLVHVSSD